MKVNTNISKLVRMLWLIMLSLAMLKCQSDSKTPQQAIIEANVLDDDTGSSSLCVDRTIDSGENTFTIETNGLVKVKRREQRLILWDSIEVIPTDPGSILMSFSYPTKLGLTKRKTITTTAEEALDFIPFTRCIDYFKTKKQITNMIRTLKQGIAEAQYDRDEVTISIFQEHLLESEQKLREIELSLKSDPFLELEPPISEEEEEEIQREFKAIESDTDYEELLRWPSE